MDVGSQAPVTAASSAPPVPYRDPGPVGTVAVPLETPPVASGAPAVAPGSERPAATDRLSSAVSAVFAGSSPHGIEVSLRVAHHPNEIIAVFRDKVTGEIINQVPSETVVQLAEFFQQEASGALLDREA